MVTLAVDFVRHAYDILVTGMDAKFAAFAAFAVNCDSTLDFCHDKLLFGIDIGVCFLSYRLAPVLANSARFTSNRRVEYPGMSDFAFVPYPN